MTLMVLSRSGGRVLAGLALASILGACNSDHSSMPTPAIYVGAGAKPMFESASANHGANNIDLLYVTDRAPIIDPDGSLSYGVDRSRYMSFGSLTVDIDGAPSDAPTGPQLRLSSVNRIGSFLSTSLRYRTDTRRLLARARRRKRPRKRGRFVANRSRSTSCAIKAQRDRLLHPWLQHHL